MFRSGIWVIIKIKQYYSSHEIKWTTGIIYGQTISIISPDIHVPRF